MKRASLAELMGSKAAEAVGVAGKLSLSQLPSILGDAMPDLPRNQVGRHRLVSALHQRFGPNFRALPGVSNLINEFDSDIALEDKIAQLRSIRYQRKEKR